MKLPESWIQVALGQVIDDMQPGFAKSPGQKDVGTVPQIRTHNVTPEGRISLEGIKHVAASEYQRTHYSLKQGDVVFNNTNSEVWVGKTAVFDQEGEFVFSNHMTRLRVNEGLLDPDFLAHYLHFLWSVRYSRTRAKRWVSQAGIEVDALARFKIPLPTIPEQQRIVEVLQRADAADESQHGRRETLTKLLSAALDDLVQEIDETGWIALDSLIDLRYGTSVSADADASTGTPVLRIPNVIGGEVDLSDLKYVILPRGELALLKLDTTDVLIVRSNGNPDYVGRCAPITEDLAQSLTVYASYLIRLRTDGDRLHPEFLSAFLNSGYGRAAMRNAIRTTAGQSNLSGGNLAKVRIPVPVPEKQKWFKQLWRSSSDLRRLIDKSDRKTSELRQSLTQLAMIGELTEQWRAESAERLAEAATERDESLRSLGTRVKAREVPVEAVALDTSLLDRPARQWLLGELSEFQRRVLDFFLTYTAETARPLLTEDPEAFAVFCEDDRLTSALEEFEQVSPNRIGRTLSQLAELGLIAKVSLVKPNEVTGERDYLKAFRSLQEAELRRLTDVGVLRRLLAGGARYYFTASLDYETSERAGAAGTFQVATLTDERDKDRTDLVDQGKHYATQTDLIADIAERLGVDAEQVELEED